MSVNESKSRSPRHWEGWRNSGAVGTLVEGLPAVTYPSWKSVIGIIELRIKDPQYKELRTLLNKHRDIVHETYDAWYQKATKRPEEITPETDKMAILNKKYLDELSPDYNPDLIDRMGLINSWVRDSFPSNAPSRR